MKSTPYWIEATQQATDLPVARPPDSVDVAIVGGGYVGLSAARLLARSGATVAVFAPDAFGRSAGSRNGGLAVTGLRLPIELIFRRYGAALGHVFWQLSLEAIDLVGELVADEGLSCNFRRQGHIVLAQKPHHFRKMEERVDWYRYTLGHRVRQVTAAAMRSEIGSGVYYGGMVDELSGSLDPARFATGLARAAAREGALLCAHVAVTGLERDAGGFRLQTSQEAVSAREVIVATNGDGLAALPGLRRKVFPLYSTIVVTEPLPDYLGEELSPRNRVFVESNLLPTFFRLTPDRRLLMGGAHRWRPPRDLGEPARELQKRIHHIFPQLRHVTLTHAWTGESGITLDWMPHIGSLNGVYYVAGYDSSGVALATYLGAQVATMLTGQQLSPAFSELRHWGLPLAAGSAWLMPLVTRFHRAARRLV